MIRLRPLSMNDLSTVIRWSEDAIFCRSHSWALNRSIEELTSWWHHCINDLPQNFKRFAIDLDERFIGYVDFLFVPQAIELGIAIGERTLWGQGIGTQCTQLALDFATHTYNVSTYTAETTVDNIGAQKMLTKLGFIHTSTQGTALFYTLQHDKAR